MSHTVTLCSVMKVDNGNEISLEKIFIPWMSFLYTFPKSNIMSQSCYFGLFSVCLYVCVTGSMANPYTPCLQPNMKNGQLLEGGAILLSSSPWCNAIILVRKKDRTLRFYIDFWWLNKCTKKDAHPMPRIPEIMESMVGARIFSCMDSKSSFWQV